MAETELSGILNSVSGSLGNFVFRTTKNGIILANKPRRSSAGPTLEQQRAQNILSTVAGQWSTLTDQQRDDWANYASVAYPLDKDGRGAGPSGQAIFIKVNWYRTAQNLAILSNAPTQTAPAPVTAITNNPIDDNAVLEFTIVHSVTPVSGTLLVEATKPIISPARNPVPGDYRLVRGLAPESFLPLQASGGGSTYTVSSIRFPIADALRFGLRLTILTADGVPSQSYSQVFTRVMI